MICVFEVTGGPARGRRFWLRSDQQMQVGRISTADFSVPADPHMSRHHLILEGASACFRVRDVGSANGTFVNNAKVSTVELFNGDRIRAGETTFTVSVMEDGQNPHGKDGFSFSAESMPPPDVGSIPPRSLEGSSSNFGPIVRGDSEPTKGNEQPTAPRFFSNENATTSGGWWTEFGFFPSDQPFVFEQPLEPASDTQLSEIIRRLQAEHSISAIVNTESIGTFAGQLIGTLEEDSHVIWHSSELCSVTNNRSRDFRELVESTRDHDALILIGAHTTLDQHWTSNIVQMIKRPSVLSALVRDAKSGVVSRLLSTLEFVLFEAEYGRCLNLLQREVIELSD